MQKILYLAATNPPAIQVIRGNKHIKCAVFSGGPVTSQPEAFARSPTSVSQDLHPKVRDLTDLMLFIRSGYYYSGPGE